LLVIIAAFYFTSDFVVFHFVFLYIFVGRLCNLKRNFDPGLGVFGPFLGTDPVSLLIFLLFFLLLLGQCFSKKA